MFDHELEVFRFAHLSVREYLEAQLNFTLGAAHSLGAEISLLICLQRYTELAAKYEYIFRPYAFLFWRYHCQEAKKSGLSGRLHRLLEDFLLIREGTNLCYAKWVRSVHRLRRARDEMIENWKVKSNNSKSSIWRVESDDHLINGTLKEWRPAIDVARADSRLAETTIQEENTILDSILGNRDYPYDPTFAACFLGLPDIVEQNVRSILSSPAKKVGDLTIVDIDLCERRNVRQQTYLHLACHSETSKVLRLLLQYRFHVRSEDKSRRTALHYAVNPHGLVPLNAARQTGVVHVAHIAPERVAMIRSLIEKASIIDAADISGETALHCATNANFCPEAQFLLEHGASVDARTQEGRTPLHLAANIGNTTVARLLLQSNANIEARDKDEMTPLLHAAMSGHTAVAQLLLQSKANIEARTSDQKTPLLQAAQGGHTAVAQLLLQSKANIEARTSDQKTPLLQAAQGGHTAVVQLLLQFKADIEARDWSGKTPLFPTVAGNFSTVWRKSIDTGRLLLQHGADINAKDSNGKTPLAESLRIKAEAMAHMLIDEGASVKGSDLSDNTVLHYAAYHRLGAVLSRLLEMGAHIDGTNIYGATPLHEAIQYQSVLPQVERGTFKAFHIVQLLVAAGADIEMSDNRGQTPLHLAAQMADKASIQILLDQGANIKAEDNEGLLPLDHAAVSGSLQVFSILFNHWAGVMAESSDSAVEAWLHRATKPVDKIKIENLRDFDILQKWKKMSIEDLIEWTTPGSRIQKTWAGRGPKGLISLYRARRIVREMRARREAQPVI